MIDLGIYPGTAELSGDMLSIGGCRIDELAEEYGTPLIVVDEEALRSRAREYVNAFKSRHERSEVLFAAKSFPSASVIKVLSQEGCGVDVASRGELEIALAAGSAPSRMVLHGNAKRDSDISEAIGAGVGYVVIDNLDDVERISRLASKPVPALLRVSPSVAASTHSAMITGQDSSKFGIPSYQVADAIAAIRREPLIDLKGLHAHIGSQVLDLDQFEAEVEALAQYEHFEVYDLGGGLGVRYLSSDVVPSVDDYAECLVKAMHRYFDQNVQIMVEPGRSMIAKQVVTVYQVVTVKRSERVHVAVDGGMSDNLEVSLYGQLFEPAVFNHADQTELVDIVGQHCESGDTLVRDILVRKPSVGDLVVNPVTGAYCYTMRNNYNAALAAPIVFCGGSQSRLAVRRQTYEELLAREVLS